MSTKRYCDLCKDEIVPDEAYWTLFLEPDETDSGRQPIEHDLCLSCKKALDACIEGLTKS